MPLLQPEAGLVHAGVAPSLQGCNDQVPCISDDEPLASLAAGVVTERSIAVDFQSVRRGSLPPLCLFRQISWGAFCRLNQLSHLALDHPDNDTGRQPLALLSNSVTLCLPSPHPNHHCQLRAFLQIQNVSDCIPRHYQ